MLLYKSDNGAVLVDGASVFLIDMPWDSLINRKGLYGYLHQPALRSVPVEHENLISAFAKRAAPPIGLQEVWAAGVTYKRSRDARMDESQAGGGADFYQKVYNAARPELFFKAQPYRVSGHCEDIQIRYDSDWNVPEPELTLFISSWGTIEGYTVGNDVSSRSIEGENPLYLPQAKSYEKSAALGPCLFVPDGRLPIETTISLEIKREGDVLFKDSITLASMKRTLEELVSWLYRGCRFPHGCFLMTGTGIVPPDVFTLAANDIVSIHITGIGVLVNQVSVLKEGEMLHR